MRLFIEINCDQILFKYGHEYDICHRNRPSMLCPRSPAAGPKAAGSHNASIERSTRPPLIARPPDKLPTAGLWRVARGVWRVARGGATCRLARRATAHTKYTNTTRGSLLSPLSAPSDRRRVLLKHKRRARNADNFWCKSYQERNYKLTTAGHEKISKR